MFALPTPYNAERQVGRSWEPCRVIGITTDASSVAPQYVVEYFVDGCAFLAVEECIRKPPPGNPA